MRGEKGDYRIFYTGVDRARRQGSMLVAEGPDLDRLTKRQVMLSAPKGKGNIKEATLAQGSDGRFHLFHEYARDNARGSAWRRGLTRGLWQFADPSRSARTAGTIGICRPVRSSRRSATTR